jgi:hypothetical protein
MYMGTENPFAGLGRFDSKDMPSAVRNCLMQMQGRADANETAMFARQLEYIYTQTYDILRPELKARKLIPVDTRVPSGADSFTYSQFDKMGEAKIVHNYAQDFPNAEIVGKQFKQAIVSLGDSYQYTIQDMRAAAMAGLPLEARKAEAARFVMELKLENLASQGDTTGATNLYGLANAPGIQQFTKVSQNNAGSTAVTWNSLISDALAKGNLTAATQEIMKDINGMSAQIFTNTKGVHKGDTLVLTTPTYAVLATTQRAPGFTDDTLLDYVLETSPWLKSIEYWPYLDTAASLAPTPGTANHGLVMMYQRDPQVLGLIVSQDFEQFAPQARNMSLIVPCHMRTGAVEVRYPKAVTCMTGAD